MQFKDITGQSELKRHLAATVDRGRVSHAQMFTGNAGNGALALALAYIQYLNCSARADGDSCGVCPSCRKMAELQHPDVHFVMPVNKTGKKSGEAVTSDMFLPQWRSMIRSTGGYFDEQMWYDALGLDNLQGLISKKEADEIIRKLSFKSFEGGFKAVLIWLPEKMNAEAANTLLKIVEEPWDNTLFVMVSQTPRLLPPTILSRVQETVVPGIEPEAVEAYFVAEGADPAGARRIAGLAMGDLIEAKRIAAGERSGEGGGEKSEDFELFTRLMRLSYNDRHLELMEWADEAARLGRERQKRFLENSVRLVRSSYMINAGLEDISYLWGAELQFCRNFAPFIDNQNVEYLVYEMETALGQLRQNGSAAIVFTHFALAVSKRIVRK